MLARIQSYLRVAASQGRDTHHIGPFLATVSRHSDNRFLNYAIPNDGAMPSAADVAALIDTYERWQRIPRLEYVPALAPAVESRLIAAGFAHEGRLPLMICRPGTEQPLPVPFGIELVLPESDADLLATVTVQNEAYGDPPPDPSVVVGLRKNIAEGQIVVLARVAATGEPVGGGICSIPADGVTEVAAIGVRAPFRRQGVAGALTTRLIQEAFAAGVTLPFLMAEHTFEPRLYRRIGFIPIGEMVHMSRVAPE